MMMIQGRYILRSSTKTVASKTNHPLITNNTRRLVSTPTPALLQSFKYDAPWIHYNNNEQQPTIKNFINGTFEEVTTATSQIPLYDPSTNKVLSYVPESTSATTTTKMNEEDALQSSGSLFTANERVLKTYHLLPEFKKVDYFIKISNDDLQFDEETIIKHIKSIPQIVTTYTVDVESIKSKDNLIF